LLNEISYIYKILNNVNGKFYIGSTNNFNNRKITHLTKLNKGKHENKYLQRAWNKYGEDNFEFIILEIVPYEDQFNIEQKYLDKLKPFKNKGYNIAVDTNNGFNCGVKIKACIFCNQEFETTISSQKYCNYCRNYQDNYYKQLENEGKIKLIGGHYKFV